MSTLTKRVPYAYSTAIQQRANATKHFDGTMPANGSNALDSPLVSGIYKYAPADNGGLVFWNANEPIVCAQLHIYLGGDTSDISVYLVNLDPASADPTQPTPLIGEKVLIEAVQSTTFIALDESRFKTLILPGQALQVITSAGTHEHILQAVASLERTYQR